MGNLSDRASGVGAPGADGNTVLNGTVDPTTEGVDGDFYINTTTNEIFGPKTGGAWGIGTSLVGPVGADGIDGSAVLNGTVDPTTEGVDGDFYINTASNEIFGPKTGGAWGTGTSLVGTAGADGIDGTNGVDGKTVLNGTVDPTTEGVDGDFYINTTSNEIFGPKTGGAWGTGTSLVGPEGPSGVDFITQQGSNQNGNYRVWNSGIVEQWLFHPQPDITGGTNLLTLPLELTGSMDYVLATVERSGGVSGGNISLIWDDATSTSTQVAIISDDSASGSPSSGASVYVRGTII